MSDFRAKPDGPDNPYYRSLRAGFRRFPARFSTFSQAPASAPGAACRAVSRPLVRLGRRGPAEAGRQRPAPPVRPVTAPRSRRAASGETDRLAGMPSRLLVRLGRRQGLRQQPRPRRRSSVRSAVLGTGRPARSRRYARSAPTRPRGSPSLARSINAPAASRPSTGPLIIDA